MTGIACKECAWDYILAASQRTVIKAFSDTLANLINRPPSDLFHIQGVGVEDLLRFGD